MRVMGIDPGPEHSGWVILDVRSGELVEKGVTNNDLFIQTLASKIQTRRVHFVVIEKVVAQGMSVAQPTFETCGKAGEFFNEVDRYSTAAAFYMPRREVKLQLLGKVVGNDAQVNQAVRELMGDKGTRKNPGPLYGMAGSDMWAALSVTLGWCKKNLKPDEWKKLTAKLKLRKEEHECQTTS